MPDDYRISDLSSIVTINNGDLIEISTESQSSQSGYSSVKATMTQIAEKIAENTTFVNLQTTSKNLIGAINEVNSGSGGTFEIEGSASGSIASFTDGGNNIPCKSVTAQIVATQAGSGTPSPSNVRSISGVDEIDVFVSGINVWNENWESGVWDSSGNKGTGTAIRSASHILLKPSTTYFCYNVFTRGLVVRFYDANKNVTRSEQMYNQSFTTNANEYYITINTYNADNITTYSNNISINYPNTYKNYNAYNGNVYTCTLPSTCYGGSGDVTKANGIRKNFNIVDLGTLSYTYDTTNRRMVATLSDLKSTGTRLTPFICSCYQTIDDGRQLVDVPNDSVYSGNVGNLQVYIQTVDYTDPATFQTSMSGQKLVYPIEPTALTTSALSIPTLSGYNNIYANCSDVDLEYFNENADEIAELVNVYPYEVSGVLTAGQTSITLSSGLIKTTSTIDIYTDNNVDYNSVFVSSGSVTISFDAQASNLGVKVRIS